MKSTHGQRVTGCGVRLYFYPSLERGINILVSGEVCVCKRWMLIFISSVLSLDVLFTLNL